MEYTFDKNNIAELVSVLKNDDTISISGEDLMELIEKKKLLGKGGRKQITIDTSLFESVAARWDAKEITAQEAMRLLDLKPNTFYRRMKERSREAKKVLKQEVKAERNQIRSEAKEVKEELKSLKKQIKEDTKKAIAAVDEKKQIIDMEREILHEKISAEAEHRDSVDALKEQVAMEANAVKMSNK